MNLSFSIIRLVAAAQSVLRLVEDYTSRQRIKSERSVEWILHGFLEARFGNTRRQFAVESLRKRGNHQCPAIDFRIDASRASRSQAVVEVACRRKENSRISVRKQKSRNVLYPSMNLTELQKLSLISATKSQHRILLLMDSRPSPENHESLGAWNRGVRSKGPYRHGAGRVTVLYVHKEVAMMGAGRFNSRTGSFAVKRFKAVSDKH